MSGDAALSPEALAHYRVIVESLPDALILVDEHGRIALANRHAERLFGYGPKELEGAALNALIPERVRSLHDRQRMDYERAPSVRPMASRGELSGLRKDGSEFAIEINLAPVRTDAGLLVCAAIRDVTEARRRLHELRDSQDELERQYRRIQETSRLKSEFLANMSHELRTPLNAIIGFSELLHDGKAERPEQQREFVGDILNSARHLLQLINDILDLAKVEAGKMEFHPEPIHLGRVIAEVTDVVRTLLARKRLVLKTEIDPSLTDLVLDPAKLKQVLYNYLSNAIKFSHDGGTVLVRARAEDAEHFRLEVADSGIGIQPQDLRRLFLEFEQLDDGISKKFQGTGLGLALTRRIVAAQGGSVGVASEAGKGSTFHAVLPRRGDVAVRPLPSTPVKALLPDAPRVLLVEDDDRDRAQIEAVLAEAGFACDCTRSGVHAIELAGQRRYDAVVLDLLLPDADGWEVLAAIRARPPNAGTRVVVVSVVAETSRSTLEREKHGNVVVIAKGRHAGDALVRALEGVRGAGRPG